MRRPRHALPLVLLALAAPTGCSARETDSDAQRRRMVESQIVARGVADARVLRAMRKVPRHAFVPPPYANRAYGDYPLPIGEGQTISQPYIVAFMTEALDLAGNERVLEIGTGSGYQAAVLAEVAAEVYTIEILPALGESARERLAALGYTNVHVRIGDGYKGWPERAPFDAIIVTCAPEEIPAALVAQLAEGGRMVIPVGNRWGVQKLVRAVKEGDAVKTRDILDVRFVPMVRSREPSPPPR